MVAEGLPAQLACRVLDVSESGFYAWRSRPPSERAIRHAWLTDLIREVHVDFRGVYGYRRVHAELTLGHGLVVGSEAVWLLMRKAGLQGVNGRPKYRRIPNQPTAGDLVERDFARERAGSALGHRHHRAPDPRRARCTARSCSTSSPGASLAGRSTRIRMPRSSPTRSAWRSRNANPLDGTVIHSDQGTQFTSWAFTRRALDSGLLPSMGSVGDCYDNAVIESFWSRMQVELLDRQRWRTRVELANAIFEYLEIFHNRQRRHSALGMLSPIEFEDATITDDSGMNPVAQLHQTQGTPEPPANPGAVQCPRLRAERHSPAAACPPVPANIGASSWSSNPRSHRSAELALQSHAVSLGERGRRIAVADVRAALAAPVLRAPAVANDEGRRGVADDGNGMAAVGG